MVGSNVTDVINWYSPIIQEREIIWKNIAKIVVVNVWDVVKHIIDHYDIFTVIVLATQPHLLLTTLIMIVLLIENEWNEEGNYYKKKCLFTSSMGVNPHPHPMNVEYKNNYVYHSVTNHQRNIPLNNKYFFRIPYTRISPL